MADEEGALFCQEPCRNPWPKPKRRCAASTCTHSEWRVCGGGLYAVGREAKTAKSKSRKSKKGDFEAAGEKKGQAQVHSGGLDAVLSREAKIENKRSRISGLWGRGGNVQRRPIHSARPRSKD